MQLRENIALTMRTYRAKRHISIAQLADMLGIAQSSLQSYLKGTGNMRLDTVELIAEKLDISIIEMVSGPAPVWEQAETVVRAAKVFSTLTPEQQEEGIRHFLALAALFAKKL